MKWILDTFGCKKYVHFSPAALDEVDFGHFRPIGAQKIEKCSPAAGNEIDFGHFMYLYRKLVPDVEKFQT